MSILSGLFSGFSLGSVGEGGGGGGGGGGGRML
jgi:hypothetical protein